MATKVDELKEEIEARGEATSGNKFVVAPAAARGDCARVPVGRWLSAAGAAEAWS